MGQKAEDAAIEQGKKQAWNAIDSNCSETQKKYIHAASDAMPELSDEQKAKIKANSEKAAVATFKAGKKVYQSEQFQNTEKQVAESEGFKKFKTGLKNYAKEQLKSTGPKNVNAEVTIKAPK